MGRIVGFLMMIVFGGAFFGFVIYGVFFGKRDKNVTLGGGDGNI
jgi:hypothetical protein